MRLYIIFSTLIFEDYTFFSNVNNTMPKSFIVDIIGWINQEMILFDNWQEAHQLNVGQKWLKNEIAENFKKNMHPSD